MKPRLPRFTVLRLMALVVVAALALWLRVVAIRVEHQADNWLLHMTEKGKGDRREGDRHGTSHATPFWPRYWRYLAGRPWPGSYECPCGFRDLLGPGLSVTVAGPKSRPMVRDEMMRRAFKAFAKLKSEPLPWVAPDPPEPR
jgi:hypothetical protein